MYFTKCWAISYNLADILGKHMIVCWHSIYFFYPRKKIALFFSFHVEYICVSFPVILFITGEAAPAALPAYAWWTALPLQALLHWKYLQGWMLQSDGHATTLTQSQVLVYLHKWTLSSRGDTYHWHHSGADFSATYFSALEDLHPVTTMRLLWWIMSTRSGFLR